MSVLPRGGDKKILLLNIIYTGVLRNLLIDGPGDSYIERETEVEGEVERHI
jgi:hypothetical protein